ncbi:MAG: GTPase Era [Methanocella sp. PtaU1.Bin125]|nr:MAG: GTPase Era [Methanocella sp. PtaU1.Bin125]
MTSSPSIVTERFPGPSPGDRRYGDIKKEIGDQLAQIKSLLASGDDRELAGTVDTLGQKLEADSFNLAVLGQFKRGKTTFINALLGAKVLPTAIVPHTSIVTILKYGPEPSVRVVFNGGATEVISPDRLADYVTESGNPKNAKGVRHVEVSYPSGYLRDGFAIIDTPGIGSTFAHNTATTYGFLSRIDAAVFMLSVDPPISDVEMQFLADVSRSSGKFFFILNKIDYVDEDDLRHAVGFNARAIGQKLGREEIRIFPMSSRQALEAKLRNDPELLEKSGYPEFERALERFLVQEKGKLFLLSVVSRGLRAIESKKMLIELEENAGRMSLEALDAKIAAFDAEMEKIRREKEANAHLIDWNIGNIERMIEDDIVALKAECQPKIIKEITGLIDSYDGSGNKELLGLVNQGLQTRVTEAVEGWRVREEQKISGRYEELAKAYYEGNDSLARKIGQISSDVFSVDAGHITGVREMAAGTQLFYQVDEILDNDLLTGAILRSINMVLPFPLFRKAIRGGIEEKVMQLVDQNTGRVRYAFAETLTRAAGELKAHQRSTIESLIASMSAAAARARAEKARSSADRELRSAELISMKAALETHRKALEEIREKVSGLAPGQG